MFFSSYLRTTFAFRLIDVDFFSFAYDKAGRHNVGVHLAILTPRLEATRGLFLRWACHFDPRSDDEDDTPLQSSALHQREDVSPLTYDLTCNKPNTRRIFNGIGIRTRS
ncbi:hypothetical protein AVEN_85952-1 [Araneus ventricosus]|uniref:Uncharacterized protein n=1 Tax=Araneus ventricosus TaxID=182803 RepID=A0A4Y2NSE3_ARAVE|nr:hypothetical protein AVEN_85952-1 [Araneus ventricosus]